LAAIGGGIFLVSAALDPNRLSDELKDAAFRATGRELSVAGGVHLRLGLTPQIELDDVSLANPPGASRPQMLTATRVTAELALLPLLGGEAVISSLVLASPDLALERSADGTENWRFSVARRPLFQKGTGAGSGGGGSGRHAVKLQHVRFEGGHIGWQAPVQRSVDFTVGTLDWSAEDPDAQMTLSANGTVQDLALTLSAKAGSLRRLMGGPVSAIAGTWPLTIDIKAGDATLHVDGGINHPDQGRGYSLRATGNAPSLDSLAGLFPGLSLPPLAELNATMVFSDDGEGRLRTSQLSAHAGAADLGRWVQGLAVKQVVLSAPGPGQLAQLNVDGIYQATPLRVSAAVMQPDAVAASGPIQLTLTADAAGASLNAHGAVPPAWDANGLDLTVNGHAPDLSALSPLVGHALPAAHDVTISGQLGDAGAKLRGVTVHDLVVSSSVGDLAGDVSLLWAPRAALNGALTSRLLNLDALLSPSAGSVPGVFPPAPSDGSQVVLPAETKQAGETMTPGGATLPLARMRTTDMDVTLAIGELTLAGKSIQDVQAHLDLKDGKLALNPLRARAPEGTIIGGVSIDASSDTPPVAVTLRSPAMSAAGVTELLGYPGGADGTMQVDAQLSGVGQSVPDIKASLDGHLGLAMVNGQVSDSLVERLIGAALDSEGMPALADGTSQVRCFATRIDFVHGVGTVRALSMDTSKLSLDGSGEIDLHGQTVDLHLRPRLRVGATQVAAPVWLHGPFGALQGTLDPVLDGGRVGLSLGGSPASSACGSKLELARNGLGGPLPAAAPATPSFKISKPKDLLKGLFH
jgi:AsmA protein